MKNFILLVTAVVSMAACKQPSEQAGQSSNLAATSTAPWRTLAEIREINVEEGQRVILKFGSKSCIPCVALDSALPTIVSQLPKEQQGKFILVSIDLDKEKMGEKFLYKLLNATEAGKVILQNGLTIPLTIVVDNNSTPKAYLQGYNAKQKDIETARYKKALLQSLIQTPEQE